jgi:methenyltetrahydrofolate cyclohydrolase
MSGTEAKITIRVGEFLTSVANRPPAPSAGAVVALSLATAAGLTASAARRARLAEVAEPADALRTRLVALADRDAREHAGVLAAVRLPAEQRPARTAALSAATEVPLAVATDGVRIAGMAARLAEDLAGLPGDPEDQRRGAEARAAARLAEAGVRACVRLVEVHVRHGRLDRSLLHTAHELERRATSRV